MRETFQLNIPNTYARMRSWTASVQRMRRRVTETIMMNQFDDHGVSYHIIISQLDKKEKQSKSLQQQQQQKQKAKQKLQQKQGLKLRGSRRVYSGGFKCSKIKVDLKNKNKNDVVDEVNISTGNQ